MGTQPPSLESGYGRVDQARAVRVDSYQRGEPGPRFNAPRISQTNPGLPGPRGYDDREYGRDVPPSFRPRDRDDPRSMSLPTGRPSYDDYRANPVSGPPLARPEYRGGGNGGYPHSSGGDRGHWNPPDAPARYNAPVPADDYYNDSRYAKNQNFKPK